MSSMPHSSMFGPEFSPLAPTPYEGAARRYPWIRAWGRLLRWKDDKIANYQLRADNLNAPYSTIEIHYEGSATPTFYDLADIRSTETLLYFVDWSEAYELPIPHTALRAWLNPNYEPKQWPSTPPYWEQPTA